MLSISHFSYRGVSTEKSTGHEVLLARIRRYLDCQWPFENPLFGP